MLGMTAAILMVLGGVSALQSAAVVTGGPFAFVCLVALIGLVKEFSSEHGRVLLQDETVIIGESDEIPAVSTTDPADD